MFLTPPMPIRDHYGMASAATSSPTIDVSYPSTRSSQRGRSPSRHPGDLPPSQTHYEATSHFRLHEPFASFESSQYLDRTIMPVLPPVEAVYPSSSPLPTRDLSHRLVGRRERRVLGRTSPYARPRDVYSRHRHADHHTTELFPHEYYYTARRSQSPLPRLRHVPTLYDDASHTVEYTPSREAQSMPLSYRAREDWRLNDSSGATHWTCPSTLPEPVNVLSPSLRSELRSPVVATTDRGIETQSPRSPATSQTTETPSLLASELTLVGQLCAKRNCYRQACELYGDYCEFHKPSRLCKVPECRKCAKTGGYCIAHGGGRRCQVDGCTKSAKEGGRCIAHGGGKRCHQKGCDKAGTTNGWCVDHGDQ